MDKAHEDFKSELQFHKREWLIQRLGWIGLCGFIIAALLGFFGNGPMSERVVGDSRVATVKYERFARYASSTRIELTIQNPHLRDPIIEIDSDYLRDFEITSIVPAPRSTEILRDRYRIHFDADSVPGTLALHVVPQAIGRKHARISIAGREIELRQFIYP